MNRNYSNVEKRIWTDKYVHEHHAYDKNKTDMYMYHNRYGVIVSWENVWTNSYVQMYSFVTKPAISVSKGNSI